VRPVPAPASEVDVELRVNGELVRRSVPARLLLADFLRDRLELTGTHLGCEHGICGACTVLLDGAAVRSCITLAVQADGAELTTIEGLTPQRGLNPMQQAFTDHHGLQCGFCTPGILTTLAAADPSDYPDEAALRELLSGNLCRCTGYQGIVAAVRAAWDADRELRAVVEELLRATGASRTTLRLARAGAVFPVVAEACAPGVQPMRGDNSIDLRAAPTFRAVHDELRVVVQEDVTKSPLPTPPEVVALYGVRAQMLAPVVFEGRCQGTISVHDTNGPRQWTREEREALDVASATVRRALMSSSPTGEPSGA
jgi:aerobic carbon-monoxide dehydrogenase small subunit